MKKVLKLKNTYGLSHTGVLLMNRTYTYCKPQIKIQHICTWELNNLNTRLCLRVDVMVNSIQTFHSCLNLLQQLDSDFMSVKPLVIKCN